MNARIEPEVLLYHRIVECEPDNQYLSVSPKNFEAHLDTLASLRHVIPLYDTVHCTQQDRLIDGCVSIIFNDGYADNLFNAVPLLEKYRCHATVFVNIKTMIHPHGFWYDVLEDVLLRTSVIPASIFLEILNTTLPLSTVAERLAAHEALFGVFKTAQPRMVRLLLHELLAALGRESTTYVTPHPLLSFEQLGELAKSPWIEIGSHILTHPIVSQLSETEQSQEIMRARTQLEEITRKPVRLVAYPLATADALTPCQSTAAAELYGVATVQGGIPVPCDPASVPRRWVRNWSGKMFRRWLDASDRNLLERQTTEPRLNRVHDYLTRHMPEPPKPALRKLGHVVPAEHTFSVTHLNTILGAGGAARVAELLAVTQEAMGYQTRMLTSHTTVDDARISLFDPAPSLKLEAFAQAEGVLDYHLQGSHSLYQHEAFRAAQIIHFHNLHGEYFNPWSLAGLSRLRPSVWTLHDMQALTGRCAHAFTCTRWHDGCGLCPSLQSYPPVQADNTHRIWRDKRDIYACSPVQIVTPSHWLAQHVRRSSLRHHPLTVIPNGIDTTIFSPRDKKMVRAKMGIPANALVIGGAAHMGPLHNYWKGGAFAVETLRAVRERLPNVLFLGRGNVEKSENECIRLLPFTRSEEDMADFYSSLDLMIYPTQADNCPLVVLEAMACGTPVVAFSVGGVPELVDDGQTGAVLPAQDGAALTRATLELLQDEGARLRMAQAARKKAEREYDMQIMAQRYEQIYATVLETWPERRQRSSRLRHRDLSPCVLTPPFRELAKVSDLLEDTGTDTTEKQPGGMCK